MRTVLMLASLTCVMHCDDSMLQKRTAERTNTEIVWFGGRVGGEGEYGVCVCVCVCVNGRGQRGDKSTPVCTRGISFHEHINLSLSLL